MIDIDQLRERIRLSSGTQILSLGEARSALCRCGLVLAWVVHGGVGWDAAAACEQCGMSYTAITTVEIKIEGHTEGVGND